MGLLCTLFYHHTPSFRQQGDTCQFFLFNGGILLHFAQINRYQALLHSGLSTLLAVALHAKPPTTFYRSRCNVCTKLANCTMKKGKFFISQFHAINNHSSQQFLIFIRTAVFVSPRYHNAPVKSDYQSGESWNYTHAGLEHSEKRDTVGACRHLTA